MCVRMEFACGVGADCTAILPNGACYEPNTLKDHCDYAVNCYFQKNAQNPTTCSNFGANAVLSQLPPGEWSLATHYIYHVSISS